MSISPSPLNGKNILEYAGENVPSSICRAIALAGRLAADLGADVRFRGAAMEAFYEGAPAYLGLGKRLASDTGNVQALLTSPSGAGAAEAHARVLISPWPEGAAGQPSSTFTIMASSGLLDIVGEPERSPLKLPGRQLDLSAGLAAFTAMSALMLGATPGLAHVSLFDVAVWLNWKNLVMAHLTGKSPSRKGRAGEWQTLRCKDGWIGLVYRESDWPAVKRLIGDPALDAPELNDRGERRRRAAWIADRAETAFAKLTRDEIANFARRNRIPLGPVCSPAELLDDPQYAARAFFQESPAGAVPRLPLLWNGSAPAPVQSAA
jgi:crotonobetainyl-CoA:carnitine CoA-transferase CaiB-like acyl-CoA transferase